MHMYNAAYLIVVLVRVEPCCHCSGCIFFLKPATMLSSTGDTCHSQMIMPFRVPCELTGPLLLQHRWFSENR